MRTAKNHHLPLNRPIASFCRRQNRPVNRHLPAIGPLSNCPQHYQCHLFSVSDVLFPLSKPSPSSLLSPTTALLVFILLVSDTLSIVFQGLATQLPAVQIANMSSRSAPARPPHSFFARRDLPPQPSLVSPIYSAAGRRLYLARRISSWRSPFHCLFPISANFSSELESAIIPSRISPSCSRHLTYKL